MEKEEQDVEETVEESAETLPVEGTVPPAASVEDEETEKIIATLRGEAKENFDKYLRAVAELENFKKRAAKERSDLLRYSGESMARDILDVVDNLERALLSSVAEGDSEFRNGVKMILSQFISVLERHGITPQSAFGGMFDPAKHEALASVPTGDKPAGTVIEEYRKAYIFKDKLLRPGQVVVAAALPQPAAESSTEGAVAVDSGGEEDKSENNGE